MRLTATIQLTTIELVIGKPNGLAISTAFCVGPCSASSGVALSAWPCVPVRADVAGMFPVFALTGNAQSAVTNMKMAVKSRDASLVFNLEALAACSIRGGFPSNFGNVTEG